MGSGDALSVVIPSWREGPRLIEALRDARSAVPGAEIVVVACDESDEHRDLAMAEGATWVACERPGRGAQLRAGAAGARGTALLFLHADTTLPEGAGALVTAVLDRPGVAGGAFRVRFDRAHPLLDRLASLACTAHPATVYGDQAMFCSRAAYDAAGGFRAMPLFEDVDFARRLARVGRLVRLPARVTTSARRFERHGPTRQFVRNTLLLGAFLAGVPAERLARHYAPHADARATVPPA